MRAIRLCGASALVTIALLCLTGTALAEDISGPISTTRTIRDNSRLVGDVTCTVTGAPCIQFAAGHIELRLNGFTITGTSRPEYRVRWYDVNGEQKPASTAALKRTSRSVDPASCSDFARDGILFNGTLLGKVEGVTTTTNCMSGIRVTATSSRITLGSNVAVRNGSAVAGLSCGGI